MVSRIYSPYAQGPNGNNKVNTTGDNSGGATATEDATGRQRKPAQPEARDLSESGLGTKQQTSSPQNTVLQGYVSASASAALAPQSNAVGSSYNNASVNGFYGNANVAFPAVGPNFGANDGFDDSIDSANALQTVQMHSAQQRITGRAVFSDMRQTAQLLGAPPVLQAQVESYLTVAEHQAQQKEPNVALVQSVLLASADELDTHVTQALGNPSTVVREWVEALLSQPVDWQNQQEVSPFSSAGKTEPDLISPQQEAPLPVFAKATNPLSVSTDSTSSTVALENAGSLSKADALRLKGLLGQYQQAQGKKDWLGAQRTLDRALAIMDTQPKSVLTAKLYSLKANAYEAQTQNEQALQSLNKAELALTGAPDELKLRAQLSYQKSRLHLNAGQTEEAQLALEQGLGYLSEQGQGALPAEAAPLLLAQARLSVKQGEPKLALLALSQMDLLQPNETGSLLNNKQQQESLALKGKLLAQLGQPPLAESTLKEALRLARKQNDTPAMAQGVKQLAAFYLEQGQVEKAQAYLSTWQQVQQQTAEANNKTTLVAFNGSGQTAKTLNPWWEAS